MGEIPRTRSARASALLLLAAGAAACGEGEVHGLPVPSLATAARAAPPPQAFEVPPPPFSEGVYPCSDCHAPDVPVRAERRELRFAHQEIRLHHDEANRWCLDCHDAEDRDQLHLASGRLVPFERSYELCGQCHGDKYRDWRAGVHGRRTGRWNGPKRYLLCVHCHDAHSPRFEPMEPEAPPLRPERRP